MQKVLNTLMRIVGAAYGIYGVWAYGFNAPAQATYYLVLAIWVTQNTGDND